MSRAGGPKTGGRKKGTPNKATLSIERKLAEKGIDVIDEIINLLSQLDPPYKMRIYLNLLEYIYPKRKSIEISLEQQALLQKYEEFKELPKEQILQMLKQYG